MGAHYGLAFLLLRQGEEQEAADHLRAFLADPPKDVDAGRHIDYARQTLAELMGETVTGEQLRWRRWRPHYIGRVQGSAPNLMSEVVSPSMAMLRPDPARCRPSCWDRRGVSQSAAP